jgi:hypothetical protein
MRQGLSVDMKESNEIDIPRSSGEKLTISTIEGHHIAVVPGTHVVKEKNQYLARNNHLTGSRKLFPEESFAYHRTVRRSIAMNTGDSGEPTNDR